MTRPTENPVSDRSLFPRFFFVLLFIIFCSTAFLALNSRVLKAHDGFVYLSLQYYFLNHTALTGQVPQWIPYMTFGTVATWWYAVSAGILTNALFLLGKGLAHADFLALFYGGSAVDEILLVVGTWLLARRFFSSSGTVFFVTATVLGSSVWMDQPWFNFHFYYAVPLILHFLHVFLEKGQWRYVALAFNLLAMQTLGNLPYCLPVTTLFIFLYGLLYGVFHPEEIRGLRNKLVFRWPFAASLLVAVLSFWAVYQAASMGTQDIVNYNPGRLIDRSVPADVFQVYGGNFQLVRWAELFLGISPALDYTLYIGILPVVFLLMGIVLNPDRNKWHFLFLALIMLLFSRGTFLAVTFYHIWPMMKFYRHVALVAVFVKLLLCFLAGFGLDIFINHAREEQYSRKFRAFSEAGAVCLALVLGAVICFISYPEAALRFLDTFVSLDSPRIGLYEVWTGLKDRALLAGQSVLTAVMDPAYIAARLQRTAFFIFLAITALLIPNFIRAPRLHKVFVVVLLVWQVADVFGYKLAETRLRTAVLTQEQRELFKFQPLAFMPRRDDQPIALSPRARLLETAVPFMGVDRWSLHAFLFKDQDLSFDRTEHWLRPVDELMRAFNHKPLEQGHGLPSGHMGFPENQPVLNKIAGITEDKIRFFTRAYAVDDKAQLVSLVADSRYQGDLLFVSSLTGEDVPAEVLNKEQPGDLAASDRLDLPYTIDRFDADHVRLSVFAPADRPVWMTYSDAWHKHWRAHVNGKAKRIYQADLGFKAVLLDPGTNSVDLVFRLPGLLWLQRALSVNALIWLVIILGLAAREVKPVKLDKAETLC